MNQAPQGMQSVWQAQPTTSKPFSLEELHSSATRFQKTIRRRNIREYVAALLVVGIFGFFATKATLWHQRLGHELIAVGAVSVMLSLRSRGSSSAVPNASVAENCLSFHRRELERQRDLLRSVWRWYLGPFVLGLTVLFVGQFVHMRELGLSPAITLASAATCAMTFIAIGWLNARAARRLQAQIEALSHDS